jgi:hypothetical protein
LQVQSRVWALRARAKVVERMATASRPWRRCKPQPSGSWSRRFSGRGTEWSHCSSRPSANRSRLGWACLLLEPWPASAVTFRKGVTPRLPFRRPATTVAALVH